MAATDNNAGYSVTPTQSRSFIRHHSRKSEDFVSESQRPANKDARSMSSGSAQYERGGALAALSGSAAPGAFSADLKGASFSRSTTPRPDLLALAMTRTHNLGQEDDELALSEQRQAIVRDKIAKELKIKLGTENMLEALLSKSSKQTKEQRQRVEQELGTSNKKLAELKLQLNQEIQRANSPTTPPSKRMTSYFRGSPLKPPPQVDEDEETQIVPFEGESPTVVLTETLQALEIEGMAPDYYIDRANTLVDLFKRNPTLKYDLAWSVFSLRVQVMLLSDSTDVVAAAYRLTRYAITDRASIRTIRSLHTDELVVLSLVKKGNKAILEREQAVKFVRAFLDVKDGVHEISRAVVRTIVAVAEQHDDRLKNICILTLTELLMKHPPLLISANGINTLTDTLAEGTFPASESLVTSFLHILDVPRRRKYLKSGREFEAIFAPFTDPFILGGNEEKLKTCAKAISAMLKNWPGFLTLSMYDASSLRSLLDSLLYPAPYPRDLILELLFDVLRIKPPSWSNTFLAGRRLTTYGRVMTTDVAPATKRTTPDVERDGQPIDLVVHFSALVLATLVKVGLIPALSTLIKSEEDLTIKRKATLLLTEVLKLATHSLPNSMSSHLQVLGDLISPVANFQDEDQSLNMSLVYQIESINKTMNRQAGNAASKHTVTGELAVGPQAAERSKYSASMDAEQFKQAMTDTQVPAHSQYMKWKWDLIHSLIEGPLMNPKRLEEAIKGSKFLKRIVGFYRPFKYRFSMIRNTRPNQRYVRTGCALLRTLAQTSMGIQYLRENKLLPQIAECLAQVDRQSGLTSASPLFDRHQMAETLSGGYFAIIGALSESSNGLAMMERWHMMNMFYHIVEVRDRDDLIRALLGHMDFSLDSHLRVILSQALTSGSKSIRIFATRLLRRYAVGLAESSYGRTSPHWALRLILTQLYDPDVEVCEIAIKILEEACNQRNNLDFVVKCRPSLDHLGEFGAPLLLRFLSTSVGYHYLNGLDYITQEMDDWFLGRNDAYVTLVEASLARAYVDQSNQRGAFGEELVDFDDIGLVPPHFYRELARTSEGCKLLRQSGHFYDFTTAIREYQLDEEDLETLTKVKGCLWAVGNVGSMELGAPFLDEDEIVNDIIRIAEGAEVISMRGTAFFVLGLISRSTHGFEMLAENGWETAVDSRGRSLGLCMPTDLSKLCSMKFERVLPSKQLTAEQAERYKQAATDPDRVNARILKSIVEMGNLVMYKKAAGELRVLKDRYPDAFKQVPLFQKTLIILESHHFRLQPKQYVLDLFGKAVMRQLVLEEDSSEEDLTGSDTG